MPETPDDDVIAVVLQDLRIVGVDYGRCTLRAPWAIDMPAQVPARFHHVVAGHAWLVVAGQPPLRFGAGASFLLPHGGPHVIRSDGSSVPTPLGELPMRPVSREVYDVDAGGDGDGDGEACLLVCCSLDVGDTTTSFFSSGLPDLIVSGAEGEPSRFNAHLVEAMAEVFGDRRAASATLLTRLADLIVAAMLGDWIAGRPGATQQGWLAAMKDGRLGKALLGVYRRPGEAWNVERLAQLAGMSRSSFAERFTRLVGRTPAQFLLDHRMRIARRLLAEKGLGIGEIGRQLGYGSEAAFSRAFKRVEGVAPAVARRRSWAGSRA